MPHFQQFLADLNTQTPHRQYNWTRQKELSCQWLLDRALPGKGVDVGGTDYLVEALHDRGDDVTFYDMVPPRNHEKYVTDDMANILDHFELGSLDYITTRHTLEHSVSPMYQLWAYSKLLKTGGQLLVIVPMHCREWVWFHTHWSCLPQENWLMLFYRVGFDVHEIGAGTWNSSRNLFVELRFDLRKAGDSMRLRGGFPRELAKR